MDRARIILILLTASGAAVAVLTAGGCSVASVMASQEPGQMPRAGQLADVAEIGGEQVRFAFQFKVGPDPKPNQSPAGEGEAGPAVASASPPQVGAVVRIVEARFNDTRGRALTIVDQEVRNESNLYTVLLTSSAVPRDSYEVVCQAKLIVGGYQVKLGGSAFREVNLWRADPRSFKFAIYGADQNVPWWERNLVEFE